MARMSVTAEVFQADMSPSKAAASANMSCMLVTPERSGTSVAVYTMLEAPRNALSMLDHFMSPHPSIEASFAGKALGPSRFIRERLPVMETRCFPEFKYVCEYVSSAFTVLVLPSPQSIATVPPECTSRGSAMTSLAEAVFHVVTNTPGNAIVFSEDAAFSLPTLSYTAFSGIFTTI